MHTRQRRIGLDDTERRILEALRAGGQLVQAKGYAAMMEARVVPVDGAPWAVSIAKVRRLVQAGKLRPRSPLTGAMRWGIGQ